MCQMGFSIRMERKKNWLKKSIWCNSNNLRRTRAQSSTLNRSKSPSLDNIRALTNVSGKILPSMTYCCTSVTTHGERPLSFLHPTKKGDRSVATIKLLCYTVSLTMIFSLLFLNILYSPCLSTV